MVKFIGSRKDLNEDKMDVLEEMVMDSTKAQAILEASKMSMGMTGCSHVIIKGAHPITSCCCFNEDF